jgi:predicted outer membrane protein
VIKASELALHRSQALRVREVAERLIAAHRGSSAQLSLNGRRLNLLPSATVGPRLQAFLEQLNSSVSFDRDYAAQMKRAEQEAVAIHRSYEARGASPTLVPVARALAPIMEQQQRLVSYL